MRLRGAEVELVFDHAASGLRARDGKLTGFALAGSDRVFYPADARIEGERVIVSCARVSAPVAVRSRYLRRRVGTRVGTCRPDFTTSNTIRVS